jgi:hypothetical protein
MLVFTSKVNSIVLQQINNSMKNLVLYLNLILLIMISLPNSCISSPQVLPVKGTGDPIDKNFQVSDFHGIDVSSGFDVILVQGNSEDLTITAQENLFEHIIVKVDQGILRIYTERGMMIMATKPMKARISFKSIDNLQISGGGDVTAETPVNVLKLDVNVSGGGDLSSVINTDELVCRLSGGGDADIDGNIKNYNLNVSGGGDVKSDLNTAVIDCSVSGGGDLTLRCKEKVNNAHISISGGGDNILELNVEKLKCSVSGGGNGTLKGQASDLEMEISGGGDVNAKDLLTETTSFNVSGGSDFQISASKELNGNISGGGDLYYSGNPEIVTVDAKGGSEVHRQ